MTTCSTEHPVIGWSEIVNRQTGLLTPEQNAVIRETRVLMLGLGGMGMNAAAQLVRAGFERFTLVDFDVVDGTAANRTPFSFDDTLGLQKVEAARRYMLKINPCADIKTYPDVKLKLDSPPDLIARLTEEHNVASWAMDGIAGRIHYTRIAGEVGARCATGKPAVESWALPYHFCAWTFPNAAGSPGWEDCFRLPTAGLDLREIDQSKVRQAQELFFQRLGELPHLLDTLDSELMARWFALQIPNRTLGTFVVGCSAMIAYEMLKSALMVGGAPLAEAPRQLAPWMAVYDVRRNVAYEYNFQTRQVRWRHPVTGKTVVEDAAGSAEGADSRVAVAHSPGMGNTAALPVC
jgi:hypothetical protein